MKNTAYALVLVSSILAACGSDDDKVTIGHNNASTGSDGGASGGPASTTTTPPSGTTLEPTAADASADACTAVAYYYDGDGDGVGGAQTQSACEAPGAKWVTTGGDCDDANADVFPGQTGWFGIAYSVAGTPQRSSFDYDCSTHEEEKPEQAKASPCTLSPAAGCTGAGFLPNPNSGALAQSYCGSTRVRVCRLGTNGGCTAIDGAADVAFQCH